MACSLLGTVQLGTVHSAAAAAGLEIMNPLRRPAPPHSFVQGVLEPNARPGVFKAVDAIPAMSELENMAHAATNSYDQYEVRGAP
jgi:hypothetical protein